jgi:hypothetical protein
MAPGTDLQSQLDELRRTVAALQASIGSLPQVSLAAVESAAYLGQALGLTLTVLSGADSTPLAGVPVTLVSSWGVLRGNADLTEGSSMATATAADGTVRVTLRPQVSLDANEDQDALEAMLAQLDPAAASPAGAVATLQTLAQQYRWEANQGYRDAVDAYFRDFGQKVLRSAASRDYMASWETIPATVIAQVAATDTNTAAAAAITVQFRDWLGPWLQVYRQYANAQLQLQPDFTLVKQVASSAAGIIAGVFGRAAILVDGEFGEVGKNVAQQAAQTAIGSFLDTGISDLPADTQSAVRPILDTGARTLTAAGATVVAALGQTHAATMAVAGTLANKVDTADLATALAAKANASDMVAVQTALGTKADATALGTLQTQVSAKADGTALATLQTQVNTKVDQTAFQAALQSKADAADLKAVQTSLATKADATALATLQTQVSSKVDQTAFQAALQAKADATDLKAVQATLATKADATALATLQTQVNSKVDQTAFQTALQSKADAADLKAVQVALADKADKSALATLQTQVNAKVDQTTFQTALQTKADATDLKAVQATLATKADTAALTTLQTRTAALEVKTR